MNTNISTTYLTVAEACAIFKLPKQQIYSLCHTKNFPSVKFGKQWRINKEKMDEWFLRQARV